MDLKSFLLAFIPIFVAVDVVGTLPLFVVLTEGMDTERRQKIIRQSTSTAFLIAVTFIFAGKQLFKFLGVSVADFLVAGGVLLFILAIKELSGGQDTVKRTPIGHLGVVPLGTPIIAGPAVLTTSIVLLDVYGIIITLAAVAANIFIVWFVFSFCDRFIKILGQGGVEAVSKISGLLLSAIAVMLVRKGLFQILHY